MEGGPNPPSPPLDGNAGSGNAPGAVFFTCSIGLLGEAPVQHEQEETNQKETEYQSSQSGK